MATTTQEAVAIMADEAESLHAECNDERGIVREIVRGALADRPNIHFEAWFLVCCELADRAARREGYGNSVHRAYELAKKAVSARRTPEEI